MTELKEFELLLLKTIIKDNLEKFGYLSGHLDFIRIDTTKITGTGLYINFVYLKEFQEEKFENGLLSAEVKLTAPNLKNELTYCLDVTNCKIDSLEILTNEKENWNGDLENCSLN
ncbi:hypothetical protein SRABI27_03155 [Pedobacter sp. Bi27]|uniref:hypothetical protein n=1 Tax=unclassified Pedobacter TaxID=2628915 RepID=UPI001E0AB9C2|nr:MULTISPECIES: hypothetical protein [unclassified Pedobacter]CAH0143911.1 hypothetical protein SRABI36_00616 [Pedobacter sp. Bi36]CAH0199744.1 hypothetical protein SRABI126_01710 [Pedobacter sp. Bi126]CAH0258505.1 hypothetical protein SRABI27_03155 [Pedobacter sp. Bi27]